MKHSPNKPIQNPNQSVIWKIDSTEDVCCLKVKRPDPTRSMKKVCTKNFSSERSVKPDNLSENTRVEQTHDGTGQPVEGNSSSAHTVKEQFAPEENRDIALFNTNNEIIRAINEETSTFQDYHILQ